MFRHLKKLPYTYLQLIQEKCVCKRFATACNNFYAPGTNNTLLYSRNATCPKLADPFRLPTSRVPSSVAPRILGSLSIRSLCTRWRRCCGIEGITMREMEWSPKSWSRRMQTILAPVSGTWTGSSLEARYHIS